MAQNIELKLKINDFDSIKKIIHDNKIQHVKLIPQKDIYYKHSGGLLKLRIYNGNGQLIFYLRDENQKDRVSNYDILKVEPNDAENFLGKLFEIETEVIKKRNLYLYRNTRIHLDEVDGLGNYIELETVVTKDIENSRKEFDEVVNLFKLDLSQQIKSSYRTLLLSK